MFGEGINLLVPSSLGVCVLVVSVCSTSSTWLGILVSAEQLKDMHQIVIYIPSGELGVLWLLL